ncbi:MAG TPA: hypothetical protein VIY70_00140, partial [Acidimicrobiia bacterium]
MKNTGRLWATLLVVFGLIVAACGSGDDGTTETTSGGTTETTAASTETTAATTETTAADVEEVTLRVL